MAVRVGINGFGRIGRNLYRAAQARGLTDGNTLEWMWDRPPEEWPRDEQGHADAQFGPDLDLDDLLRCVDACSNA